MIGRAARRRRPSPFGGTKLQRRCRATISSFIGIDPARYLRLLMRNESHASTDVTAASFGDTAANYFALIDESEMGINHDTLGQSNAFASKLVSKATNCPDDAADQNAGAAPGDAREM